jgi:hypothetical protein
MEGRYGKLKNINNKKPEIYLYRGEYIYIPTRIQDAWMG